MLSTRRIALAGLVGLAAAMGIGRFAFTPLLPLMQADGLSMQHGAWLAGANYLGYLMGALACAAWSLPPQQAARQGLAAVAVSTLAMGLASSFAVQLFLRWAAGVASALVLVGVSSWALKSLAASGAGRATGIVYAGVGVGMAGAGLVAMAVGMAGAPASRGWWLLGLAAGAAWWWVGRVLQGPASARTVAMGAGGLLERAAAARLIACYGAFGFGYILPATFLPAMARELVPDPAIFGWTWPVFGLAAALSTLVGAVLMRRVSTRALWSASQGVMALGVLLPLVAPGRLAALAVSAVAVGGTFMVITMAGLQEAQRLAGAATPRLMAAMTAAFGTGQLAGPLVLAAWPGAARETAVAAAVLLAASSIALVVSRPAAAAIPSTTDRGAER